MRAQIGIESEPWRYEVTTTGVRAFARGVGYTDPVYYDVECARESGYSSLPAPLGYLGTPAYIPGRSDDTFSVASGTGPRPRFGMTHVLDGGTSVRYDRPLVAGEVISVTYRILELEVKQSKSLGMFLMGRRRVDGAGSGRKDRRARAFTANLLLGTLMPAFADLSIGDLLEPLTKTPDRSQLVKYAAGPGDFNPLHFDPEFPQAVEIGDNIVHGRLKFAALGQLVSDWLDHEGWVRRISAQYRGMDRRGAEFTCRAHGRSSRPASSARYHAA